MRCFVHVNLVRLDARKVILQNGFFFILAHSDIELKRCKYVNSSHCYGLDVCRDGISNGPQCSYLLHAAW